MPYTTTVAGTAITASWANTNIRDQVITPFATSTARDSAITVPVEGMMSYHVDTHKFVGYNGTSWVDVCTLGGTWTAYSPTITQGASTLGKTITYARYTRHGRTVIAQFRATLTSGGTGPAEVIVGLPVTASQSGLNIGTWEMYDLSAVTQHVGITVNPSTTTAYGRVDSATGDVGIGNGPNISAASGDIISYNVHYEAAT